MHIVCIRDDVNESIEEREREREGRIKLERSSPHPAKRECEQY